MSMLRKENATFSQNHPVFCALYRDKKQSPLYLSEELSSHAPVHISEPLSLLFLSPPIFLNFSWGYLSRLSHCLNRVYRVLGTITRTTTTGTTTAGPRTHTYTELIGELGLAERES